MNIEFNGVNFVPRRKAPSASPYYSCESCKGIFEIPKNRVIKGLEVYCQSCYVTATKWHQELMRDDEIRRAEMLKAQIKHASEVNAGAHAPPEGLGD